jgi:hypothetical protein
MNSIRAGDLRAHFRSVLREHGASSSHRAGSGNAGMNEARCTSLLLNGWLG